MLHEPALSHFPESRRIFQRNGNFYQAGEVFKQPELARTLTRIEHDPASSITEPWPANWPKPSRSTAGWSARKTWLFTR